MPVIVVNVVNRADAGMIQLGSGARLANEAVERLAVVDHLRRNKFERHMTGQTRVFRLVHHAHATTTELAHNVIVGYRLADHSGPRLPSAAMLGAEKARVNCSGTPVSMRENLPAPKC